MNVSLICLTIQNISYVLHTVCETKNENKKKAVCSLLGTSSVCPQNLRANARGAVPVTKWTCVGSLVLAVAPGVGRVVKGFKALCLGQESVISGETAEPSRSQP